MKVKHHLRKVRRMKNTLQKLDNEEDYETIVEDLVLISPHMINAAMHKLGTLREDKDIKHNRLFGTLKREEKLGEKSLEVADLVQSLEQLRPSHVYGRGENGETAREAESSFRQIEKICKQIIGGKYEE